ncbi:MAG TPA: acetyl-CoA acetyltransferase [bacterium]|jgi:acetyl-CoA C-acetyltransferase|nr:acetyl-CoA acetyltransferase [bacterium]
MSDRVAIVGAGTTPPRPLSPDQSFREMTFAAAARAYEDAGVSHRDIDSFISVCEDFHEGTSITDEYVPDQLGAVLRPVQTIAGDGIQGIATAFMLIRSGIADVVAVEAHAKSSNILRHDEVLAMGLDPVYERPLGVNPHYVAAMEMRRYLHDSGRTDTAVADVVVENRRRALGNPIAPYGAVLTAADVLAAALVSEPLRASMISAYADGAVVLVLASEERAEAALRPVWIRGIGWSSDTSALSMRDWATATYAALATAMAYQMAGIERPADELAFAEVDDTYAHKQLQHLDAARLTAPGGEPLVPVNRSGGSLGMGYCYDASALYRTAEAVRQIRGEAGRNQVPGATTGLVLSWRGVPTQTGGALVLGDH